MTDIPGASEILPRLWGQLGGAGGRYGRQGAVCTRSAEAAFWPASERPLSKRGADVLPVRRTTDYEEVRVLVTSSGG